MGVIGKKILQTMTDELVQACASVTLAYITFFVADTWLHSSGVLSLCFMGTYLSTYMPTLFPGKESSIFCSVWKLLVHLANTMIFAIVGAVVAKEVLPLLTFAHIGRILLLYLVCAFARFVMILSLTPAFAMTGSSVKIGVKEAALLAHSGLRGGVSAMLASVVYYNESYEKERRTEVLILTSGIVFITLIFNAPTAKFVVAFLGFNSKENNRLQQMEMAMRRLRVEGGKRLRAAKVDERYAGADWGRVESSFLTSLKDPFRGIKVVHEEDEGIFYTLIMRALKTKVWSVRDTGGISEDAVRVLAAVITESISKGTLVTTNTIFSQMMYPARLRFLYQRLREKFPQLHDANNGGFIASTISAFVLRWKANVEFDFYAAMIGYEHCLKDLAELIPSYAPSAALFEKVNAWHTEELEMLDKKIIAFAAKNPKVACAYTTRAAATVVADHLHHKSAKLHETLGLSQPAAEALEHASMAVKHTIVEKWPFELEAATDDAVLLRSDLLRDFPLEHLHSFKDSLNEFKFKQGEVVSIGECAGVVVSGVLGATGLNSGLGRGPGNCFNLAPAFTEINPAQFVVLSDEARVMTIAYSLLNNVYATYPAAFDSLLKIVGREQLALAAIQFLSPYSQMPIAEVSEKLVGKGRSILAEVDGFTFADDPSLSMSIALPIVPRGAKDLLVAIADLSRPLLLFIAGSGHHSHLKEHISPFVVPLCIQGKMRWRKGTTFFSCSLFEADFISNVVGEEMPHSTATGNSASNRFEMEIIVSRTPRSNRVAASPTGLVPSGSSHFSLLPIITRRAVLEAAEILCTLDPTTTLSPIPYLSKLQLHFILVLEQLMGAVWRYFQTADHSEDQKGDSPSVAITPEGRAQLSDVTESTLSFLRTFCLESFSAESVVHARLLWGLEGSKVDTPTDGDTNSNNKRQDSATVVGDTRAKVKTHNDEHNDFMDKVATWRELLRDGEVAPITDMITSMAIFATKHFRHDYDLCVAALPYMHLPDMKPLVDRASFAPFTEDSDSEH
eukprot:GILJ01016580.1.p1 GENE.GILJ01016580.1~~GILJ01016580.1.p1  ORF type:complete len:1125 (+),score=175.06 GILJ01016580.1:326-3376(+)